MIKRIVSTEDFALVYHNFSELSKEHPVKHYGGISFNPETMYGAWNNENLLINKCVLVCNFIDEQIIDSLCWFVIGRDWRINKTVATSYLWVSKSNKTGVKVLKESLKILERKKVDVIEVGFLLNSSSAPQIKLLLNKLGFKLDAESYFKVV